MVQGEATLRHPVDRVALIECRGVDSCRSDILFTEFVYFLASSSNTGALFIKRIIIPGTEKVNQYRT